MNSSIKKVCRVYVHSFVAIIILSIVFNVQVLNAQTFQSVISLTPVAAVKNTGDKPQSKVWTYSGKWWTVFPNNSGTFIWRLDGTSWTSMMKISSSQTVKADCKVVADVCHILLWRKEEYPSQLISVEYVPTSGTYKLWSQRTATAFIDLDAGTEIATIDIDGTGRMWLASDADTDITIRWSDPPYSSWSSPITLATDVTTDDIGDVIAMPAQGQIGVLWSNQNAQRFGFKTHSDGADPALWSEDEVPASQSALIRKAGMSDDHLNMTIASDGTLYCAVKTGYNTPGYPLISLLKRNVNGVWDNLYEVAQIGTRPIVILNEATGKLKVVYTGQESGGNILYKESSASTISFGPETLLISGVYDNPTSTKDNYSSDIVILASDISNPPTIYGVLASDPTPLTIPEAPALLYPANLATQINSNPILTWNASTNASSYHLQVSIRSDFSTTILDQSNIISTNAQLEILTNAVQYFWRVEAINAIGNSGWSDVWSFTTISQPPSAPILRSPTNLSSDVVTNPSLEWNVSDYATSYTVQVSKWPDFTTTTVNQSDIATTLFQTPGLLDSTLYYWRVQATNEVGNSGWSATWSFTTLNIIPNSLVGGWKMDEGSGTTIADGSVFGNNALTHGDPVWVEGVNGLALKLNGADQFATVNDAPSLDVIHGITLAAWIRPERNASQYIIQKGETVDGYECHLLSTGKFSFSINQISNPSYKLNSKTLYPTDGSTWMHVAATYDGSLASIYINGTIDKSIMFSTPVLINRNDWNVTIGAKNDGNSEFKGTLDEVRIYNYSLTAAEISELVTQASNSSRSSRNENDNPVFDLNADQKDDISVYPNPSGDILVLEFPDPAEQQVSFSLFDPWGKIYFNAVTHVETNTLKINLNELNLPSGLYFISIRSTSAVKVLKFIKS